MEKVKLNIVPKGKKSTCYASQNDNGRVVRFELFNELIPYILDGSETISIKVVRPDSVEILASIQNTFEDKAYIDVVFNANMTEVAGVGECEITITDGETVLGSRNFDMNIEIDAYNGRDVIIETETGTLLSFNTEVEDNALEYESEIPYNANGYTGLRVINTRTAPVYDKTPYLFRKTPSGSGNSCIEKLTGLSVAFNQQFDGVKGTTINGITASMDSNGVITFGGTATSSYSAIFNTFIPKINHIYYLGSKVIANPNNITAKITFLQASGTRLKADINSYVICMPTSVSGGTFGFDNMTVNDDYTGLKLQVICIDLTQMFGNTIADYLYNLETQTAGAGVQKFKELGFDKSYYDYNAGSLLSSKPVSKKVVGFNQWDEEWIYSGGAVNSKNYIRVLPNTTYYYHNGSNKGLYQMDFYTLDKTLISSTGVSANSTFTTPTNTAFIKFTVYGSYGTTYNHDICINFSDPEKNGTYEPYSEETYNLGGDDLRGLLQLDDNNNIFAYGDTKTSDGNIERKFVIVDLGSLNWTLRSTGTNNKGWSSYLPSSYKVKEHDPMYWIAAPYSYIGLTAGQVIETNGADSFERGVYGYKTSDGTITQVVYFIGSVNESPSGYLVYELATPTTESADPYTELQEAKITEEFIDERSIPIPVGQDSIYGTDIEYQDIDFDTTIYGGEIDAVNGVLSSEYNSDGSVKTTPEIIDITPTPIPVRAGDNKIFNNANGNQTIRYYNQVEE